MAIEVVKESVIVFDPEVDEVGGLELLFIAEVVGEVLEGVVGEFRVFGVVYGVGCEGFGFWWYKCIQFGGLDCDRSTG